MFDCLKFLGNSSQSIYARSYLTAWSVMGGREGGGERESGEWILFVWEVTVGWVWLVGCKRRAQLENTKVRRYEH